MWCVCVLVPSVLRRFTGLIGVYFLPGASVGVTQEAISALQNSLMLVFGSLAPQALTLSEGAIVRSSTATRSMGGAEGAMLSAVGWRHQPAALQKLWTAVEIPAAASVYSRFFLGKLRHPVPFFSLIWNIYCRKYDTPPSAANLIPTSSPPTPSHRTTHRRPQI